MRIHSNSRVDHGSFVNYALVLHGMIMGWYLYKRQIFQEMSLTFKWLETTAAFEHTNGPERNNNYIESCPPENEMSNDSVTIHTIKTTKINCSKMLQQIYDICLQQRGFISICTKGNNYHVTISRRENVAVPKNNTKMRLVPSFWLKIASDSWYSTSPEANLEIKTSMGCWEFHRKHQETIVVLSPL